MFVSLFMPQGYCTTDSAQVCTCAGLAAVSHFLDLSSNGFNPLPDDKILDRSKLKQFADDNFKFYENSRKFSKMVENTEGKGEIARYEQFLLFPQCFQKDCFPGVIVCEWSEDSLRGIL